MDQGLATCPIHPISGVTVLKFIFYTLFRFQRGVTKGLHGVGGGVTPH